jgi:hypothetical protein
MLKTPILDYIKDGLLYSAALSTSFAYLVEVPDDAAPLRLAHIVKADLLADRFTSPPDSEHEEGTAVIGRDYITRVSAQLFVRLVESFPGLVRLWFKHLGDSRLSSLVEQFVTKQVSPPVIEKELGSIEERAKAEMPDHVRIKVQPKRGQVTAVYEQDEVQLDLTVQVPPSYPLKALQVTSSKRLGVSETLWRKWMLRMTTVLFQREGSSLWDALETWRSNLDRHFEGAEPCPICYSIVHAHDHSLPRISCRTCKSRYHGGCLYKWFSTSGTNSCPTCRSVNSFERLDDRVSTQIKR